MNSRHYNDQLAKCEELRTIELDMNIVDLETSKKTIFRQIYLKEQNRNVLLERIVPAKIKIN